MRKTFCGWLRSQELQRFGVDLFSAKVQRVPQLGVEPCAVAHVLRMVRQFRHQIVFSFFLLAWTAHQVRDALGAFDLGMDLILNFLLRR